MVSTVEIDSSFVKYSDKWLVANYLKYGSVEAVFDAYGWQIPYSVPEYHRRVKKAGIVKGEGRANKSFAQALYIFIQRQLAPNLSLEKIYRSLPITLREARMSSIYRIYDSIVKGHTRRLAVGAVVSAESDPNRILVAEEDATRLSSAKKEGEVTIPFGFASKKLPLNQSLLRILQREFSSRLALNGQLVPGSGLANRLVPDDIKPFLELQILDIRVSVAHLILPNEFCDLSCCSSYTVKNHRFVDVAELLANDFIAAFKKTPDYQSGDELNADMSSSFRGNRGLKSAEDVINLRTGMGEIFEVYEDYLSSAIYEPRFEISQLNKALLAAI